jgi:YVTN family beta-propeller protein
MLRTSRTWLVAILAGTGLLANTDALAAGHAVIPNLGDGTVSIIDTGCRPAQDPDCATVVATLAVGTQPYGVAAHPAGALAYVTNSYDDTVSVIDLSSYTVVATVPVGSLPYGVAVDGVTGNAYVSALAGHTVTVVGPTHAVLATIATDNPHGLAVSPDGARVYVGNYYQGTISVIDAATRQVIGQVPVGGIPVGIAVHPSGSPVYVASFADRRLVAVDAATLAVVGQVDVGAGAAGVTVTPDGAFAYVANMDDYSVSVVRTSDLAVVATVTVGAAPVGIAADPDGQSVFVANRADENVARIDTTSREITQWVQVGADPFAHGAFVSARADPMPSLGDLRDTLRALGLEEGLATSLDAFLRQAEEALAQPDGTGLACARLQHFMFAVGQARKTKRLPAAEATVLLRDADAIRTALACTEARATVAVQPVAIPARKSAGSRLEKGSRRPD